MHNAPVSLLKINHLIASVDGVALASSAQIALGSFTSVTIDSRSVQEGSLFVPLLGTQQNGHAYIPQAIEKGASVVFIARSEYIANKQHYDSLQLKVGTILIVVEHTMYALQKAAAAYVRQFPSLIKIGVTGSAGKTTVKELIGAVLVQKYSVVMNEGNYNSETGLPLEVFKIREDHQVGIFEMGMNRKGEMAELATVLFPDLAVITNIGTAHIGIIGSKAEIAQEKKAVFMHFGKKNAAFIPADDEYVDFLEKDVSGSVVRFGVNGCTHISNVTESGLDGTVFTYGGVRIRFPLIGSHNLVNACAAISVAEHLGLIPKEIQKGLEGVEPLFGRGQIIRSEITIVQDCYNANPDSAKTILAFCKDITCKGKKIFVLGDMLELGEYSKELHEEIGEFASNCKADYAVFFGGESRYAYKAYLQSKKESKSLESAFWSDDIEAVKSKITSIAQKGDIVFLKASKGMALWRVSEALCAQVSDACMETV